MLVSTTGWPCGSVSTRSTTSMLKPANFKKRTGSDVQIYAPYVYDATMVMATAMQNANSTDPKKYLPALAKVSYDGVTGKIAFDSKGDILNGALTFYTYKGGKREMMMVVR